MFGEVIATLVIALLMLQGKQEILFSQRLCREASRPPTGSRASASSKVLSYSLRSREPTSWTEGAARRHVSRLGDVPPVTRPLHPNAGRSGGAATRPRFKRDDRYPPAASFRHVRNKIAECATLFVNGFAEDTKFPFDALHFPDTCGAIPRYRLI